MKKYVVLYSVVISMIMSNLSFAAVKINKDDASQYSKKTDYATEVESIEETAYNAVNDGSSGSAGVSTGGGSGTSYSLGNKDEEKFVCKTATKNDKTYINEWSNYKLTLDGKERVASEFYTFNDADSKFDFGVYWPDYSRLAIYYTRLSRDIDEVAKIYANKKSTPRNVVVGGEVYRYVQEAIRYPYGVEYYDYYLRNVDGKLMVIECFHEKETDVAPTYIEKIEKYNG